MCRVRKKTIVIRSIKSIRFAKNPFTSPALSIHKIEINYGKYETISISPKDTDKFIEILKKNNSQIKMK
ncbi:PH domain-containing protein [Siminovitchia fortis]|uniref:PH domain-containing protein n=1 Tax=Siminovitchia fortis TaxID=254758 RepID=UPI0011A68309